MMKKQLATIILLGGMLLGGTANAGSVCVCVGIGSSVGGFCGSGAIGGDFGGYFTGQSDSELQYFLRERDRTPLVNGSRKSGFSSQTGWLCTKDRR